MPDIVRPDFKPGPRKVRSDDLRPVASDDALHKLGLSGPLPHTDGSTRVGVKTLRELRDRAESAAIAAAEAEQGMFDAIVVLERSARMNHLAMVENQTLARRLSDLLGDDPKGAA